MRAPVSVIIPTWNEAGRIGSCLGALTEGVVDGLIREVILADGGSTDEIAEIAAATGAEIVHSPPGRGSQLAAGADVAAGSWLLFLHADTVPMAGWIGAMRHHIQSVPDRAAWFRLRFDEPSVAARCVAAWANLRSSVFALPYGDQGLLIPAALYLAVGGYPNIPLMEDVALVRKLGRRRLTSLSAQVVTSAARYREDGWLNRGWRNLTTLALYGIGIPPARLVTRYQRRK